ncbi:unnamed protein product [Microthlaspi erraticum]|uniref:Chromo domain-containing protein n=1 Tax=Microthlaspi erraticum TaxID=1685480 RepID=A0A6D2JMQ5_9BRAS|nr:unnamed protein product [Microthlaspi erraticum]
MAYVTGVIVEPAAILNKRYTATGDVELLVQWTDKLEHDNTWELAADLFKRFPNHKLEEKLILNEGSIDKIYHTYYERRNVQVEKCELTWRTRVKEVKKTQSLRLVKRVCC